ncbi:hypothetical protein [Micromonospora inositola]|uniref:Uncharacterized protein n=1 Tax=Micromonospora inositola TaxID=47865 RepID=A0A1C5GKQ7_9ACTN|nr:hypothetical protein [Micromonospora inositola]SCG34157.1 hypothetical protein GA0070613_0004 [Micromonospora inositola]
MSALSGEVYRRVKTRIGRARVQKGARELASAQATEGVLSTLAAEEAENLSRYLLSPDFDHVCFEYALHRRLNYGGSHRQYEEIVTAIRAEIIEGLRHFTSVQPHQRTLLADVLLREIVAGAEVAIPTRGLIPDEIDVSVVGARRRSGSAE